MAWPKGRKRPPDLVEKTASAVRGIPWTPDRREKMRAIITGRKASPETIEKQRTSHKGKNNRAGYIQPEETREKISEKLKGRVLPEETRQKMRLKIVSEETRQKFRDRKVSVETRQKISQKNRGAGHYNWKNGKTLLTKIIRRCFKYRQWRSDVFERDGFSCVLCGKNKCYLEADHYPESFANIFDRNAIKNIEHAWQCEEFWNINNGRTLCLECHNKTKGRKNNSGR